MPWAAWTISRPPALRRSTDSARKAMRRAAPPRLAFRGLQPGMTCRSRIRLPRAQEAAPGRTATMFLCPARKGNSRALLAGWAASVLPNCLSGHWLVASSSTWRPRDVPVALYWHCWNLDSPLLDRLTRAVIAAQRRAASAECLDAKKAPIFQQFDLYAMGSDTCSAHFGTIRPVPPSHRLR